MKAKAKKSIVKKKRRVTPKKNKPVSVKKKPASKKSRKPVGDSKKRVRTSRKPVKRDSSGKILPGSGSNGGGRPIGSFAGIKSEELQKSISRVETNEGNAWLDHQIKKSYEDTTLAVAILARLYPTLKAIEQVTFDGNSIEADKEAAAIRKEYKRRCKTRADAKRASDNRPKAQ